MKGEVRSIVQNDLPQLKKVLDTLDLFPSEYLDDMISDYLTNPDTEDIWFTYTQENVPVSIGYCAPEKFTEGTYNLYAIGVKTDIQGAGIGAKMMGYIESHLKAQGHRILIVETSSAHGYESSRKFYEDQAYTHEATIRDFWSEGDDKVIFWKKLS